MFMCQESFKIYRLVEISFNCMARIKSSIKKMLTIWNPNSFSNQNQLLNIMWSKIHFLSSVSHFIECWCSAICFSRFVRLLIFSYSIFVLKSCQYFDAHFKYFHSELGWSIFGLIWPPFRFFWNIIDIFKFQSTWSFLEQIRYANFSSNISILKRLLSN